MKIIGIISSQGHASSACLLVDGKIIAAASEERFTRKKFDDSFPVNSIKYLLSEAKLTGREIDEVAVAWSPSLTLKSNALFLLKNMRNAFSYVLKTQKNNGHRSRLSKWISLNQIPDELKKIGIFAKVNWVNHHLSHAYSSFINSESDKALCIVADGAGENNSLTIFDFSGSSVEKSLQIKFPNSIGILYSIITKYLGFKPNSDEYKVMGLSSYGKIEYDFSVLYNLDESNNFELEKKFFSINNLGEIDVTEEFVKNFPPPKSQSDKENFAKSIQFELEEIILKILHRYSGNIRYKDYTLCTSGGVFLNCVLNQKIRDAGIFKEVNFFPVADDNGTCFGAAQWIYFKRTGQKAYKINDLYLGPSYLFESLDEKFSNKIVATKTEQIEKEIALKISQGAVVSVFNGRMEFGCRALGNRSILADARNKEMKDIVNNKIKLRESFRPFAPVVIKEDFDKYFSSNHAEFPYMIETVNCTDYSWGRIPAVVHIDGTARVQTTSASEKSRIHKILMEFKNITGESVIMNTSFNLNNMPIVCSPDDAIECFLMSQIDYLAIDDYLLEKK